MRTLRVIQKKGFKLSTLRFYSVTSVPLCFNCFLQDNKRGDSTLCRPPFLFPDEYRGSEFPFSMREKVAEGRLRGQQRLEMSLFPLTLALSLRERECF